MTMGTETIQGWPPSATRMRVGSMEFSALVAGPPAGQPVVLLHGFPQFADSWSGVMRRMVEAGYRVLAFDQRGYADGARPLRVEDYAVDRLVADVIGVADALGLSRFHLAGHDWGGLIAWRVAAMHPERVRTVSVIATPHPQAFRKALQHNARQKWMSKYILVFRAPGHVAEWLLLGGDGWMLRRLYGGMVDGAQVARNVRRMQAGGTLTAALNWYRAMQPGQEQSRVGVPSLYIWGDKDVALGEAAALDTANYVDGPYRFERVAGGSHWLLDTMPDRIAGWMLEWMREA